MAAGFPQPTSDPFLQGPLWLVGCGHMGQAMLDGWIAAGVDPAHVSVVRPSGRGVGHSVRVLTDYPEDEVPAIVLLAMKPYQLDQAAPGLAPTLDPETLLVSILAGVQLASLRARFPVPRTVIRAMPNLPVRLGKGVVGLASDSDDVAAKANVSGLMAALGHAEWIDPESLFDVVSALTASGPAFLFRFIDALAEAAAALGLPAEQAQRLAVCTVEGAGALAAAAEESPFKLAEQVASPGGMTRRGLDVLDGDGRLAALVREALEEAVRRSREMGEEAAPRA